MSYLVLARKWRPRDFESLVGQEHVVRALTHALTTQRLHHAWLFTGTRGVGKTTLSRILAKSLNCETGITAKPCGQCMACTQIDAGRFVDYVELDAASNRGVDEMTQLLEQAVYAPTAARFKVYMIDEVHMLSGHAFNAMLKTLEEPPPHVKFILATTDPQKIPPTVLSRCLQFNLKQMAPESIASYLAFVLGEEQVSFEGPALRMIGQAASGSMRDALSLTDQAIAFSAGDLSVEAVRSMLGTVDQTHLVQLLQALCQSDSARVLEVAQHLSERGLSLRAALGDLAILLSRIAILQRVGACDLEDDALQVPVRELAEHMPPDLVQLFYTVAVHSRQELALAPDEYAGFIMICLRMLGFVEPVSGSEKKSLNFTIPDSTARSTPSVPAPQAAAAREPQRPAPAAVKNVVAEPSQQPEQPETPEQSRQSLVTAAPAVPSAPAAPAVPDVPASVQSVVDQTRPDQSSLDPAMDGQVGGGEDPDHDPENDERREVGREVGDVVDGGVERAIAPGTDPGTDPDIDQNAAPGVDDQDPDGEKNNVASKTQSLFADNLDEQLDEQVARQGHDRWDQQIDSQAEDDSIPPWCDDVPDDRVLSAPPAIKVSAREQSDAPPAPPAPPASIGKSDAPSPSVTKAAPQSLQSLVDDWSSFATQLPVAGMASQLALQSVCTSVRGETVTLRVATMALSQGTHVQRLRSALQDVFGMPIQLEVVVGDLGQAESAHQIAQQEAQQRHEQAKRQLEADPFVQTLIRDLGAQIVPGSIRP